MNLHKRAAAQLLALCILLPLCALAVRPYLDALDWRAVQLAWLGITPLQWMAALGATALSFAALGQYDVIVHRVIDTQIPQHAAQASGAAAVAFSQILGMGLVTGTIARWRALPCLSLTSAALVTGLVSFSFIGALLTLFAIAGLVAP